MTDGIYDSHIHLNYGQCDSPKTFREKTRSAGIVGGNIFSPVPHYELGAAQGDYRWQARLEFVLQFTSELENFSPFFWFDPTENDAVRQIETAVERGIQGFKIICEGYYPKDCIPACEVIAAAGKPVMFHSGILDSKHEINVGQMNRPIEFECMFAVKNLHFSLAHLGWPWVDEYIGMVAKSFFSWDPEYNNRMYFDLTPGTPGYYREPALRKLYLSGYYEAKNFVLWGTDCTANDYMPHITEYWIRRDTAYMEKIGQDAEMGHVAWEKNAPDLSDIFELAAKKNPKVFRGAGKKG